MALDQAPAPLQIVLHVTRGHLGGERNQEGERKVRGKGREEEGERKRNGLERL